MNNTRRRRISELKTQIDFENNKTITEVNKIASVIFVQKFNSEREYISVTRLKLT